MIGWQTHRDNVALTGAFIGLLSALTGWLTLKPNRLSPGVSLGLAESFGWGSVSIILLLWLACLIFSLSSKGELKAVILGINANLILVITLFIIGLSSRMLLSDAPSLSRISLGIGFWITILGIYTVIYAARRRLSSQPLWSKLISWAGPLTMVIFLSTGWLSSLSLVQELANREARFLQELWQHIFLFGLGISIGTLIGVIVGIWATKNRRVEKPVFYLANITQTIPSLALFGLLITPLSAISFAFPVLREFGIRGIGTTPAVIALVIYSLLPIIRNTYVGLRQVDPAAIDAGIGMGMSKFTVFLRIELPLAARLIMEGIRTASVQAIGLVTVAALIGAGGLGWFVFQGLGQQAEDLILLGALPIIILALLVDMLMRLIIRVVTPRGLTVWNQ
ncbi:ABC transporter permease subunit [Chloroflexota bacterium]